MIQYLRKQLAEIVLVYSRRENSMEKLLTLREKISFWKENKCRIEEYAYEKEYGLVFCYADIDEQIYTAERINGKVVLTLISSNKERYQLYEKENEGLYILGREGIFYKNDKDTHLEKIFNGENVTGLVFNYKNNKVYIFMKNQQDIIARVSSGKIIKEIEGEPIEWISDFYTNREGIRGCNENFNMIITSKNGRYSYYLAEEEVYNPKISFETKDSFKKFFSGEPTIAYDEENKCNMLITLTGNEIKYHERYDSIKKQEEDIIQQLEKEIQKE